MLEEAIIVSLVIIVFLFHFRSALIPILTVPIAVVAAFIPMYYPHVTSNIMSLMKARAIWRQEGSGKSPSQHARTARQLRPRNLPLSRQGECEAGAFTGEMSRAARGTEYCAAVGRFMFSRSVASQRRQNRVQPPLNEADLLKISPTKVHFFQRQSFLLGAMSVPGNLHVGQKLADGGIWAGPVGRSPECHRARVSAV